MTIIRLDSTRLLRRQRFGFEARAAGRDFDDPRLEVHYPPHLELEPEHLDVDLFVDVPQKRISGTVTNRVRARRGGPRTLELDAVDFDEVRVADPDGHVLRWQYDGRKLRITWEAPFAAGEVRRAAVSYQVTEPTSGLYFSMPDAAYPQQACYAASDHETERARHWLPCIDLPNVRTQLDFHLRAEARLTILANGRLLREETHADGTKTAHWQLTQLCPSYLACIAIGDFTMAEDGAVEDGEQRIPLAYFSSREHTPADLLRTFGRTGDMMRWLTRKLGMPFPYPKYYQFALPGMGGAMENISLVGWGDGLVQNEALAPEARWTVDQINVHEMAHSYFGDAVVCRDFAHAWLKESWATYIEQVYREDNASREEADYVYYTNAKYYLEEADEAYQRPIVTRRFKTSWDLYDAHLYEGGACRLHTLRRELGDETFWAAVRDYLQRYDGRVVETDDFRAVLEAHSGRSLGKFFDQWFRQKGYPDLKVTFNYDGEQQQGTFTIVQQQAGDDGSGPVFELATELSWTTAGETHTLPIRLTAARHTFVIAMPREPEMVRFDPAHAALHKLTFDPGRALLRRQLTDAPDIIGRIQAAHVLAKSGKRRSVQAVVDAYAAEPFWGVRREMAEALGAAEHETAVAGLAHLLTIEQDPMVLAQLIQAAGQYRDGPIRDALLRRLDDGLPPVAMQNAYRAVGAQRQAAPWQRLAEAAETPSFNGIAQGGALLALGEARQAAAAPLLRQATGYGAAPNRVRPAAVLALAQLGKGLEQKQAREDLVALCIDLLRDPWHEMRWAAARALRVLRAPEALTAVEAFGRSLSAQEQVAVERIAAALRQADKVDGSAAKKQLEDLQTKVRKLEEMVEKLAAQVNPAGNGETAATG
ncbi:MAG: HEAT repeat domain-containing protein [Anaerolineales bacterium]|nr:HEAT repeat domain-containing protein [Anaerolineales bacterium]